MNENEMAEIKQFINDAKESNELTNNINTDIILYGGLIVVGVLLLTFPTNDWVFPNTISVIVHVGVLVVIAVVLFFGNRSLKRKRKAIRLRMESNL